MEIQNNGYGELSVVCQFVVKFGNYWCVVDFGMLWLGGDVIVVVLIYDSCKVELVGCVVMFVIDDKNCQLFVQLFWLVNGNKQVLMVVVNYLKLKNCLDVVNDDFDQGDGQGCWNLMCMCVVVKVVDWLVGNLMGVKSQGVLLIGDFNSYMYEDLICVFELCGYCNFVVCWIGVNVYSYVYNGEVGYFDYVLVMLLFVLYVKVVYEWYINVDELFVLQYMFVYKLVEQQKMFYVVDVYCLLDYDLVLIDIVLLGGGK